MDFSKAFGATFREVDESVREGSPTRIVRASRIYPTSQQDLWNAVTEKKRVLRWFAEVSGDFELGGRFAIKNNADGEIIACDPPRTLGLTWEFGGNISWVKVIIEEAKDGALLTLEHEMPTDEESEAHWAQYGPGATGLGWEMALLGLEVYLSGDGKSSLDAGAAWAEGTQAKETFREWAEAWCDAHVKSGTPRQIANDMADRTAAFYTGES
jgi:uncharacterized protein YndB with AHSA1/START domain